MHGDSISGGIRRGPTLPEAATLDFLLSAPVPHIEQLRSQLEGIQVIRECYCGCATVDLVPDQPRVAPATAFVAVSDVIAVAVSRPTSPQHPSTLMLHVRDGWIAELEIVDESGERMQAVFPDVASWEAAIPAEELFGD